MAKTKAPQPVDEENYDPDGLAYELEVARGLKSKRITKRTAAEQIWTAIAEGRACETTILTWCEYVAKQITDNIIDNENLDDRLRGALALNCIGLSLRDDKYREMRAHIEMLVFFDEQADHKNPEYEKLTPMRFVEYWRSLGNFKGVSERAAAKTVKREWNKVVPEPKEL